MIYCENDKIITTYLDEPVKVQLKTDSDGVYMWFFQPIENIEIKEEHIKTNDFIGSPIIQEFNLTFKRKGSYSLEFNNKRPWESRIEKTKCFQLIIK